MSCKFDMTKEDFTNLLSVAVLFCALNLLISISIVIKSKL